jgi:demethylmenaquinone methyltransferase/2-methoxy-6-polyprenyl-1,4-benzoquinol methylase
MKQVHSNPPKNLKTAAEIEKMFSAIARRYDSINHIASMGLDFRWRRAAASLVDSDSTSSIIDFCCGTGDMAFAFANKEHPPAQITGCDFSQEMLDIFLNKAANFKKNNVRFSQLRCDCTKIPVAENSFDIASCAFGLRNIADFSAALKEMYRVLKPGGFACVLEFSLPKNIFLNRIYRFYFCQILPRAAGILSGRPSAYKHLSESVCQWHSTVDLEKEMRKRGFSEITATPLSFSIAMVFTAKK